MKTKLLFCLILVSLTIIECKKDNSELSTVETYVPLYIASSAATIGCNVISDGGSGIADCGVFLSESANAETTGTRLHMGNDKGTFLGRVAGLAPNTQYFLKAYATNTKGEAYGEELNFITPVTITDYDRFVYGTVRIGTQLWMAENLKSTHYLNGDLIGTTNPATLDITSENSPKYQWSYGGTDANAQVYGKLYTWNTVSDTRKLCPSGWHIPSDTEWTTLETTLGGYSTAGSKLKEPGNEHWLSPYNIDATNESCFSALPGGYRSLSGPFFLILNETYWWTSTESEEGKSWTRHLSTGGTSIDRVSVLKSWGVSVRCLMDNYYPTLSVRAEF
jgi:uncharacterized protein (TIGR02145 family)